MVLAVVLATATAAQCCDPASHSRLTEQAALDAKATVACEARGGIPMLEVVRDPEGHSFVHLKTCTLPCGELRLQGEGK